MQHVLNTIWEKSAPQHPTLVFRHFATQTGSIIRNKTYTIVNDYVDGGFIEYVPRCRSAMSMWDANVPLLNGTRVYNGGSLAPH